MNTVDSNMGSLYFFLCLNFLLVINWVFNAMNWEKFIELIYKLEGGKIHRNKTEKDITSKAGIYKYAQPHAEIFSYYAQVAKNLGITKDSTEWTKSEIEKIDNAVDSVNDIAYSVEFYKGYFKNTVIESLDKVALLYGSIYVNSQKIANKALQNSINSMVNILKERGIELDIKLKVDGVIGSGSKASIKKVIEVCKLNNTLLDVWKQAFASSCKDQYVELANKGEKNKTYLTGWINRVNVSTEF